MPAKFARMPDELKEFIKNKYPRNDPTMRGFLAQRDEDIQELRDHGYALQDIADLFEVKYQHIQYRLILNKRRGLA